MLLFYVFIVVSCTHYHTYISAEDNYRYIICVLYCIKIQCRGIFKYIIIFLMISAVLSFVLGILFPQYFIHQGINHTGEWKGIFGHKNALGTICAIGIFTTEIWFLTKKTNKVIAGLYFGLFSVLLFLSSSRTAIVVSLICLVIPIIYRVYKNLYNIHRSLFVSFIFSELLEQLVLFI